MVIKVIAPRPRHDEDALQLKADVLGTSIQIDRANTEPILGITFKRTLRVADNDKSSQLPPCMGTFPLYKIRDYQERLPEKIARKAGVFFPMFRKPSQSLRMI